MYIFLKLIKTKKLPRSVRIGLGLAHERHVVTAGHVVPADSVVVPVVEDGQTSLRGAPGALAKVVGLSLAEAAFRRPVA